MTIAFLAQAGDWLHRYATPGEQVFLGILMAIIGMSIVLFLLIVLQLAIQVLSTLVRGRGAPSGTHGAVHEPAQKPTAPPAPVVVDESPDSADSGANRRLAAVIAAAVAAHRAAAGASPAGFRIRRIRRVGRA